MFCGLRGNVARPETRQPTRFQDTPARDAPPDLRKSISGFQPPVFQATVIPMFESVPIAWLAAILLSLATIATVAAMSRTLPLQSVIMAALTVAVVSIAVAIVSVEIGLSPLGYLPDSGPRLFRLVPWTAPLLSIVIILNSRNLARLILRPWRDRPNPGVRTILLASLLAAALDFAVETFATRTVPPWPWQTPLVSFITAMLALVLATPWLINKKMAVR
jgi:uncharacterized membrane protein